VTGVQTCALPISSNTVGANTYTWIYALHDASTFGRNCTKCHASRVEGNTPTVASGTVLTAVHYSDTDPNLLAGTTNPAGNAANFICYNCHGSAAAPAVGTQGNRSGKDIQSLIAHATTTGQSGHPANSDTVHNSATEFTNAAFGNALGVTAGAGQRHAACLDCHDPHEAKATAATAPYSTGTVAIPVTLVTCPATIGSGTKCATATGTGTTWTSAMVGWKMQVGTAWYTVVAFTSATSLTLYPAPATAVAAGSVYSVRSFFRATNVAGPALQGAWGAKFGGTLAAFTAPTSGNLTKAPITAGTDLEATLCFKCHSAFYGPLPTSPSGAFTETDQAREFNPANVSFHPVLGSNSATVGNTGNILPPYTRTSLMTCTDCHESDAGTDPNGPHGSAVKFILKGPNTTWTGTVSNTSNGMPAGTFCANCHRADFVGGRFTAHTNGRHNIACMACHVAIPHGSGHVGLLVSLPGGAGGNAVTDSAPYVGATVRLGIGAYPTATGQWGNSNCGCDSVATGH